MALHDANIEKDLSIDGVSEAVLYAAGVGVRPEDTTTSASRPAGYSPLKVRPNPWMLDSASGGAPPRKRKP